MTTIVLMDSLRLAESPVTTKVTVYSVTMAMDLPTEPGIRDLKAHVSDYVNRVIYGRERVRVLKNGRPAVVLVSVEDAEALAVLDTWPELLAKVREEAARLRAGA
jgi:prevent-host-death family protein